VTVKATVSGKATSIADSHLLVATGRRPQTKALNLPAAGVEVDKRGFIKVNDDLQTSAPHI
jgi:pyruvate/2-oxoglutarate dehydrogenase complex dihydrolipoamide dehydrogenase (E3) component